MIKRALAILLFAAIGHGAAAETVLCKFVDFDHPTRYLKWDNTKNVIWSTDSSEKEREKCFKTKPSKRSKSCMIYEDVSVFTNLPPYYKKGFSLVVFGDIPAIHLRLTNRATVGINKCKIYPYEAYWGLIPGKFDANWLEKIFEGKNGPKGVCWTKANPATEESFCGEGGGGNQQKDSGRRCNHDRGNGGKGGENQGTHGGNGGVNN